MTFQYSLFCLANFFNWSSSNQDANFYMIAGFIFASHRLTMIVLVFLESAAAVVTDLILDCRSTQEVLFYFCHILRMDFPLLWRKIIFWQVFGNFGGSLKGYGDGLIRWPFSVTVYVRFVKLQYSFGELYPSFLRSTANDRYSGKTVRLFLSSKAVVFSKPVNKPSSISSKTVVFWIICQL